MSISYLRRIVKSFIKEDVVKGDIERLREQIRQNTEELVNHERIRHALRMDDIPRSKRILYHSILINLLQAEGLYCEESELYGIIKNYEQEMIKKANQEDAFVYTDDHSLEVYETVLQVALEDENVDRSEYVLLEKLRKKLGINSQVDRLLEVKLGMYPKPNNELHTYDEFNEAVRDLQSKGILFYCNQVDSENLIVLPEELAEPVKKILGFELKRERFQNLLQQLTNDQLYQILNDNELPVSGTKKERMGHIIKANIKPSEALEYISSTELSELCRTIDGITKVSGTKDKKIKRIIRYFDNLSNKEPQKSEDPREVYYQFYTELAARNIEELRTKGIVKKDREIEWYFEEGTRYLFEKKLNLDLNEEVGTEHADGSVTMKNGQLLLWDNKSKEGKYDFPNSHLKQFARYIRESHTRVNVFLVIVADVTEEAEDKALELKWKTETDTDVALIRARDLKFVAENWKDYSRGDKSFYPSVFNTQGILDRETLKKNMRIILQ